MGVGQRRGGTASRKQHLMAWMGKDRAEAVLGCRRRGDTARQRGAVRKRSWELIS